MAIADAAGLPVTACLASASIHEVKLAETALDNLFIPRKPEKLIGDKAYDSDKLDNDLLKKQSVEMIAPQPDKAKNSGRKLRRYQRRWKVERLFAWLQNFRRLVVRYDRHADNFLAFFAACMLGYFASFFFEIGSGEAHLHARTHQSLCKT